MLVPDIPGPDLIFWLSRLILRCLDARVKPCRCGNYADPLPIKALALTLLASSPSDSVKIT